MLKAGDIFKEDLSVAAMMKVISVIRFFKK
jgi:hypothetical protein